MVNQKDDKEESDVQVFHNQPDARTHKLGCHARMQSSSAGRTKKDREGEVGADILIEFPLAEIIITIISIIIVTCTTPRLDTLIIHFLTLFIIHCFRKNGYSTTIDNERTAKGKKNNVVIANHTKRIHSYCTDAHFRSIILIEQKVMKRSPLCTDHSHIVQGIRPTDWRIYRTTITEMWSTQIPQVCFALFHSTLPFHLLTPMWFRPLCESNRKYRIVYDRRVFVLWNARPNQRVLLDWISCDRIFSEMLPNTQLLIFALPSWIFDSILTILREQQWWRTSERRVSSTLKLHVS